MQGPFMARAGRTRTILIALICLLAPLSLVAGVLLNLHSTGKVPLTWQRLPLGNVEREQGKAYVCGLGREWMSGHDGPSPAVVLEDGVPLGPGNASHPDIRDRGDGRFSFWHGAVLFSTPDGSDPRDNGRRYEVYWPTPVPPGVRRAVSAAGAVLNTLLAFVAVTVLLPWARVRLARPAGWARALSGCLFGHPSFAVAAAVFAAALAVQLVNFALRFRDPEMARTGYSVLGVPFTDAIGWYCQGASLARGQGMTAMWPAIRPGYGLFLALFFTWTGPSSILAVVLNLVMMALTAALLCRVGEMLVSRWVGVVAGLGFIAHSLTLMYPLTLGTESLGLFCSVVALHQLLRGLETGQRRSFLSAGLFIGLSNLARPLTLPAVPLFAVALVGCLWSGRPRRAVLARVAVFGAGLALALAPWLLRQWLTFGIPSISDNTADCLYAASSPRYGKWSGAIYREPDLPPSGVKARYDYFQKKAAANLRDNPGFYLNNVRHSYVACFRNLSTSARQHLSLLGLAVILGQYFSWCSRGRTGRQAALGALVTGAAAMAFRAALQHLGLSLDLGLLVLLPLVTRPRAAVIHVVGCLGAILGVALFGMGDPDARLLFCLEWTFLLTALASLWGGCAYLCGKIATADGAPPLVSELSGAAGSGPLPRWFTLARGAVVAFLVVGAVRVAVLTAMTIVPPAAPRFFTAGQAIDIVRTFDRQSPGFLRETDHEPGQVLARLDALFDPLKCPSLDGKLVVLPLRLVNEPYYLPASTSLPHWSRYFTRAEYDRTVCYFQVDGYPTPKFPCFGFPVSFPGFVPRRLYDKDAVLICRIAYDASYARTNETILFEGIALIPTDGGGNLRLEEAYLGRPPRPTGPDPRLLSSR